MNTNVLSSVRAELLQPMHLELLRRIDSHDFSAVTKKFRSLHGKPIADDQLSEMLLALKQYYAIAVLDPTNMHAVSAKIDPLWHAHMLFSRQYREFCKDTAGYFMEHEPLDLDNKQEVSNVHGVFKYTTECIRRFFHTASDRIWPSVVREDLICCCHGSFVTPETQERSLMPFHPAMQPDAVFVR